MHVELHHPVGPRVDVDVRVVAIGDGREHAVDILANVVADIHHSNQPRAAHNRGRTRISVSPAGHVQVVGRRDSDGRLESGHPYSIVGAYSACRGVVADQHRRAVEHVRYFGGVAGVGIVVPSVVGNAFRTQFFEHTLLHHHDLLIAEAAPEGG